MTDGTVPDQDFLDKLESEGAFYGLVEYGLSEKNLDPESPLWPYVAMCSVAANTLNQAVEALYAKAEEIGLDVES